MRFIFSTAFAVRASDAASGNWIADDHVALVLGGQEARRQRGEAPQGHTDQGGESRHHQPGTQHHPPDEAQVGTLGAGVDGR